MKIINTAQGDSLGGADYISLDLVPDPFIILKADGRILDANMRFFTLVGMNREDAIERDFHDISLLKEIEPRVADSLSAGTEISGQITFHNRHFEVLLLPFLQEPDSWLVRIVFKDITDFINLERELQKRNKELIIVNTLSGVFISTEDIDLVLEELLEKVMFITDFPMGWLLMNDTQHFSLKTSTGISAELQQFITEGGLDNICNNALTSRDPIYILESSVGAEIPFLHDENITSLAIIPLVSNDHVTGMLFLASSSDREWDFDLTSLPSLVGHHVSHIIDKITLFQESKRLAATDSLTGLYNSKYFYKHLDIEVARAKRYGSPVSIVLFDIDNFKKLNNAYGRREADEILQGFARTLISVSRETDVVVRYGGEEFIIILPNTAGEEATALARRILQAVRETTIRVGPSAEVSITLSGGIATFPQNASSARSLLSAADNALCAAKEAGKNTVICSQEMTHE